MEVKYSASPSFWSNFSSFNGVKMPLFPNKTFNYEQENERVPLSTSTITDNSAEPSKIGKVGLDCTMEGIFLSKIPFQLKIQKLLEEKYDYDYKKTKAVIIGNFEGSKPSILYLIENKEYGEKVEKWRIKEENRIREEEERKRKREEERRREEEEMRRREAIIYEYKVRVKGNQEVLEKYFRIRRDSENEDRIL